MTRPLDPIRLAGALALVVLALWAYWPTAQSFAHAWNTQPDYSHGWFVIPVALLACWMRRDTFPGLNDSITWSGFLLILVSAGLRYASGFGYLEVLDGYSIPFWVAGVVCVLGGYRLLLWSLPGIAFLFFMVPLPFSVEQMLSYPLQRIATLMSCWALQTLGQPALAENNILLLGDHRLEVAQACSGLRIFMSIAALAFGVVVVVRRPWWQRLIILASIAPIALVVNSIRIVTTGMLYQLASDEAAEKFSHDFAGLAMIPLAVLMFFAMLWYLGHLIEEDQELEVGDVLRQRTR